MEKGDTGQRETIRYRQKGRETGKFCDRKLKISCGIVKRD